MVKVQREVRQLDTELSELCTFEAKDADSYQAPSRTFRTNQQAPTSSVPFQISG